MTLLYFAPVRWDSYAQRPHHFVRHFLRQGHGRAVIWVDPYPTRLPAWRDLLRIGTPGWTTPRPEGLTVVGVGAAPIEPLPGGRWVNRRLLWAGLRRRLDPLIAGRTTGIGIGRPSALALEALHSMPHQWSVYDAMDDFPEFYRGSSRRSVEMLERAIAERVNTIVTSSSGLWTKFSARGAKRLMVRNGFEMASLPNLSSSHEGRPVLGYLGCVGDWFDWSAVRALAQAAPHADLHIVGPRTETPGGLPANITLLPACPHEEAVDHLRRFSIGLIPFKQNRLTESVDPIKYYAYRAMGLPVLTTRFGDMIEHGGSAGTCFFDDAEGLAAIVSRALGERADPAAVARFRAEHDWQQRFTDAGLFEQVLPS